MNNNNNNSKKKAIAPAMNKDTVSAVIADVIKKYRDLFSVFNMTEALYRNEDVGIKDVTEAFYKRVSYDYPNLSFEEFVDDIMEWVEGEEEDTQKEEER